MKLGSKFSDMSEFGSKGGKDEYVAVVLWEEVDVSEDAGEASL